MIKGRQVVAAAALVAGATAAVAVTAFAVGMGDDAGAGVLAREAADLLLGLADSLLRHGAGVHDHGVRDPRLGG